MRLPSALFAALFGTLTLVPAAGDAGAQGRPAGISLPKDSSAKAGKTAPRDSAAVSPKAPKGAKPAPKDSLPRTSGEVMPGPLRDLGQKALAAPEKLVFDIVWGGWSFRWVNAGQATVELLPTERPDRWRIQSLARSNKFFQSFYPVRDTVFSIIDARGIYPLRFEKRLHEGGYHARVSAVYDQKAHTLSTLDTTLSIEPFTHDVLSALYYIRTQPLKVGDSFDLAAVSGKKKYNLRVICHGRETVKVPAGEFKTLIVEPLLKDDGLFKAKGKLTIWVTDDEQHIPVKMQSKIPVGSIKAELVSKS